MKEFPTREEIRDMKFSSLACRIHDWIHSTTRSVINKNQKTQCAGMIASLEAKMEDESANESRLRIVQRLKKDLEGLVTYAQASKRKPARAKA
jgi:hypothetical protein